MPGLGAFTLTENIILDVLMAETSICNYCTGNGDNLASRWRCNRSWEGFQNHKRVPLPATAEAVRWLPRAMGKA